MSKLIILACSRRKSKERHPMPAIERYDGPMFMRLRRYLAHSNDKARVLVLSAEYGLIEGERLIPYYDCRMTSQRAQTLRPQVTAALRRVMTGSAGEAKIRRDVFLNLGRMYMEAVRDAYDLMAREHNVTCAKGSPGRRLTQMHTWLYGAPPPPLRESSAHSHSRKGKVRLRGVQIDLSADQVMKVAREALLSEQAGASGELTWYVVVNERRVGPKWIVSQVTGLPVSSFHTDEARRVLRQLGIDVHLNINR